MKKLLALLAVVLAVVSCQKEINGLAVDRNGEAEFTVSVGLSEDVTRAAGVDSAKGGINNVKVEDYDLRYILEVYDENGVLAKERMVNYTDANETSTSFQLRLVPGRGYKFVAWADFVRKGTKADYHYNTSAGLTNITIQGTQSAMNESRDAYTEMPYISNFDSKSVINMTLTRPFAKLRIVTTDMKELYSNLTSATIQYTVPLYNSFNALTETASGEATDVTKTVNYGATTIYTNENPDESGKMTLYADYFFGAEEGKVHFTLDVKDATNFNIPTVTFNTDIPVQRNFLTTIYGPVLTDANNVTVTIDPAFENPELEVKVISGHYTETVALEKSGTYIFEDLKVNADAEAAVVVKEGVEAVIAIKGYAKLNGKKGIVVEDGAKLTIEGISETRSAERGGSLEGVATEGSAIGGKFITINNLAALTAMALAAKAGDVDYAYGIGAIDAEVTINNTMIDYVSGAFVQPLFVNDLKYGKSEPEGASAIGGANVTIENSEIVKAEGGSKAAAIGNKYWAATNIVIKNSILGEIFGGNASAAIGGSRYNKENKQSINIAIEGSIIANAVGGTYGAGIGSGYDTYCATNDSNAVNKIEISTSTITAKGGKYAAGIGTGHHAAALTGSIDAASKINATSGDESYCDESGYRRLNTVAQGIGYGSVDANCEFKGADVTFSVAGEVIASPSVLVTSADDFNRVMALDYEYINVILGEDITVAGATGVEYGGADTKMIVIDGNGKTLTYKDGYRTYVKMANAEGKIVFKNMNLFRETTGGSHWHDNNMKFCCNAEFNNV